MSLKGTFTPKASLTEAPTNLKEAIDWVLRVTGRDGKGLGKDECICGLAAAVTDLLQSVELEYNGYQGDVKSSGDANKGATQKEVTDHLNGLFSLVQGLGGTSVVRTYIDQLAQVLSALVGWSKIDKCNGSGKCSGNAGTHGDNGCQYLPDIEPENKCKDCGCMKWKVENPNTQGTPLGRKCKRCSSDSSAGCQCNSGGATCKDSVTCKCALAGKCCKCCCNGKCGKCKKDCICINVDRNCSYGDEYNKDSYMSAYPNSAFNKRKSFLESDVIEKPPSWKNLEHPPPGSSINSTTITDRRHHCAQILLGSVCLIWSGITYMYWTGKWHGTSPRWNNNILDGTGLDDGTLSQWLQALGFPKTMLNNSGPGNRLDAVIWDGLMGKLFLGFTHPTGLSYVSENNYNTAKQPIGVNYPGFVHTIHRDSFNKEATVFPKINGSSLVATDTETNQHKLGALFKLYILSCAYFTGLQKKTAALSSTATNTPRTIREILYWLSALPYSPAYPKILEHSKGILQRVAPSGNEGTKTLSFLQEGRPAPITVDEYNLFAHFQAVTQYCPLVLIGIQGGLKGTENTKEPAIHSLYANTECHFTYPTVSIQAYNQVVHYIRALFYQLYFLRKQCAVKVALGGKWRECRYGKDVVSKGVISWMCLGCNPMEHDRKNKVEKVNGVLGNVVPQGKDPLILALKTLLETIGDVVVQLGNAQEALERRIMKLDGVRQALHKAVTVDDWTKPFKTVVEKVLDKVNERVTALETEVTEKVTVVEKAKEVLEKGLNKLNRQELVGEVKTKLEKAKDALTTAKEAVTNAKTAITTAKNAFPGNSGHIDPCKNIVSASIDGLHRVLQLLKDAVQQIMEATMNDMTEFQNAILDAVGLADVVTEVEKHQAKQEVKLGALSDLLTAITQLISMCTTPKCPGCNDHSTKCGQPSKPGICPTCLQPTTTGVPSPLQAFLEDRLPGFSCKEVVNDDKDDPTYPPAASHLGHCGGSGQCCPLPMGFRGQFYSGSTSDMTGSRLYGILYFFSNENMMQSCVYTLVRVTAELSATTPQVLGDVFGFFRGGVGNPVDGKNKNGGDAKCNHIKPVSEKTDEDYFCGWCASGLREEVKAIEWIPKGNGTPGGQYMDKVGKALRDIKGDKGDGSPAPRPTNTSLSRLTENCQYLSPLTGELYTAVSATFGHVYLQWVLYLSDALEGGLKSLASAFKEIECRGCRECDPNKCKKGEHGQKGTGNSALCQCQSIVSCTGVLPVLYRHGFGYGNPFNLEGYRQKDVTDDRQYDIKERKEGKKRCHEFLESLNKVLESTDKDKHPLSNLLSQVGQLQYDIRLPWIFVLTLAWLVAVLYLAFGAIWPLDWTHMRSHWLRGGEHQWQCMWYKVMTGRKGVELMEYFGRK